MYVVCLALYPLAFAGFVIGFGCPVWLAKQGGYNHGLWQQCNNDIIKNCTTFDFDKFDEVDPKLKLITNLDWLIGVRAVEIFALVMLTVAAFDLVYENCNGSFRGRQLTERVAPGLLCILGGLGGLAGIITYAVKTNDSLGSEWNYSWALALVAAGSGLAVILGVGFCVSGIFLEPREEVAEEKPRKGMNGHAARGSRDHLEMQSFDNPVLAGRASQDNLPGFATYNGLLPEHTGHPGPYPPGPSSLPPAYNGHAPSGGPPPVMPKSSPYYSDINMAATDPGFDLSEGYVPVRSRPSSAPKEDPYSRGARASEDPYSRGGRMPADPYARGGLGRMADDPYSRGSRAGEDAYFRDRADDARAPRAGYNDPYGFDRDPRAGDRLSPYGGGYGMAGGGGGAGGYGGGYGAPPIGAGDTRDSFYKPGRF